jgi:tRNA-dihydrouridine synthase
VVDAVHDAGHGRVPCIGNGDIRTPFDAGRMVERTTCDGVMIGRAAVGAPWLLRDTAAYMATGELPEPPTLRDRLELLRTHFGHLLDLRGERVAVSVIRQRLARYSPHLGPSKPLHVSMNAARDAGEVEAAIDGLIEASGPAADEVPVTWRDRAAIFAHEAAARRREPAKA